MISFIFVLARSADSLSFWNLGENHWLGYFKYRGNRVLVKKGLNPGGKREPGYESRAMYVGKQGEIISP